MICLCVCLEGNKCHIFCRSSSLEHLIFFSKNLYPDSKQKVFYGHAFTTQMGCQAVSDSRESKTNEKYKQESFELSPNIDKYKSSLQVCTIRF